MFCCVRLRRLAIPAGCVLCAILIGATALLYPAAATAAPIQKIALPIIMYHSLAESEDNPYAVSPERFERDLIYLRQAGYTTVVMREVIDYVDGKGTLPEKPIMLTFDDGHYNNYHYAFPLLKKYGCKIVLSPIGRCLDEFSERAGSHLGYSYVTWTQLREMTRSGLVEIGNHSYDLHENTASQQGIRKRKDETEADYRERLLNDVGGMQQRFYAGLGIKPLTLTYPFGFYSRETLPIAKELGFRASLTCEAGTNTITGDTDCLYNLRRYLRPRGVSSEDFFTKTVGFT